MPSSRSQKCNRNLITLISSALCEVCLVVYGWPHHGIIFPSSSLAPPHGLHGRKMETNCYGDLNHECLDLWNCYFSNVTHAPDTYRKLDRSLENLAFALENVCMTVTHRTSRTCTQYYYQYMRSEEARNCPLTSKSLQAPWIA